jgi:hypothetical protein
MRRLVIALGTLAVGFAIGGCGDDIPPAEAAGSSGDGTGAPATDDGASGGPADTGSDAPSTAVVTHSWGVTTMAPLQETQPCIQWTLNNEAAVYVNGVTLSNDGAFHHSNWFVVPEELAAGPDGFFDCDDRGFAEIDAAAAGTVLTAQSTQSRFEKMELPTGVVVKIPPRHKILAGAHMLNLANAEHQTELRMSLDIIHPRDVEVVTAPFRVTYADLNIPASTESRFTGRCDFNGIHELSTGEPLSLKLYYVLPHYHYLGNFFDLTVLGGPNDGDSVFRLEGFAADAIGAPMDPPVDLAGADGFQFTCGFSNWRDVDVGWGIGDQEMCVMLGLADMSLIMDGTVWSGSQIVDAQDGIQFNEGPCSVIGLPKNAAQMPPTPEEIAGDLYVPPTDPTDAGLPPVDDCEDTPASATPAVAPTLSNVRDTLFVSSCAFSSCHGIGNPVAGLDLLAPDLHAVLLNHSVQTATTAMPLVTPGEPENSWLYQVISQCEPTDDAGNVKLHMPLNDPTLSDPRLVALVRDWIAAGALDN